MTNTVIKIDDLSKLYRLGEIGTGTLSHDLVRWWAMARGKPDPYLAVGQPQKLQVGTENNDLWALKGINLEVRKGEILGIIGKNGAGKSTLLKLISRVTSPTTGHIKAKGRIASLLEVGTGMHPEMTARENIYLNGAILGMKKQEIQRKFDEIVQFADVEKFVDTPVKRYSSGMKTRLGFSVAAHLEPDTLIVDEVLAVGDSEFQRKCIGKMRDVANYGRTILFVSHNIAAIERLCSRAILLKDGKVALDGDVQTVTGSYLKGEQYFNRESRFFEINDVQLAGSYTKDFSITAIQLVANDGSPLKSCGTGDGFTLRIHYEAKRQFVSPAFVVHVNNYAGERIIQLNTQPISGFPIDAIGAQGYVELKIDQILLTSGYYYLDIGFVYESTEWIVKLENVVKLFVGTRDYYGSGMALDQSRGVCVVPHRWSHVVSS